MPCQRADRIIVLDNGMIAEQGRHAELVLRGGLYAQLADYVRVKGADLKNGLLHIDLVREVPEAMKPRKIEING